MFATAYPVRVDGALDRHLSRWLPAVPHYLVVGLFVGGAYAVWDGGPDRRPRAHRGGHRRRHC